MVSTNNKLVYIFTFIATILILLTFTLSGNAQTLYSCEVPFDDFEHRLFTIDQNTGATLSEVVITLPGRNVRGCNGMAKDPTTGVCYVVLNVTEPETTNPRILAVVNPFTGQAREIGNTGDAFSSIAFDSSGTLYGVTGNGGSNPETLFTINKNTGVPTFFQTLGNGGDGEVIAFNPVDGLMYHNSGDVFESINLSTGVITPILDDYGERTAMVHQSGNVFLVANFAAFESITTTGVQQNIGDFDIDMKGLAFDCGIPTGLARPIPTLSEWGLIAMAGVLGLVGFFAIRRRKVTA